ncbi:SGNH/GDSL hydrolase family protein [Neobacillus sp. 3P2-tot-E-2]|uniref:SGNH/GDSL hydrolase family protein n=1 Tax=Neobacillus sp. 3P2-tot-E-2 TaxID=3132212 RepID=UPI0039A2F370
MRDAVKAATIMTVNIASNDFFYALQENPNSAGETLKQFAENISTILKEIDHLNKEVQVYVLGYYNPFQRFTDKKKRKLTRILNLVNDLTKGKTEERKYTFVETERIINENYDECLTNPEDFHLSSKGYQLIAHEIFQLLQWNKIPYVGFEKIENSFN